MVAKGGTRTRDFHLMRVARWPLLYPAMATWMGLEPTITGETVQRISHYATRPNLRVSSLIRSQLAGGPGWDRTSRAFKHLIYSQVRYLLRDTDPYYMKYMSNLNFKTLQ